MGQKREEMKVKLMKEAEAVIDELLDWEIKTAKPMKKSQMKIVAYPTPH